MMAMEKMSAVELFFTILNFKGCTKYNEIISLSLYLQQISL